MPTQPTVHIGDDCHPSVVAAIEDLQRTLSSTGTFSRRVPLKTLLRELLEPALRVAGRFYRRDADGVFDTVFGQAGLVSYATNFGELDGRLCVLARNMPLQFVDTTDTFRHAMHVLADSVPAPQRGQRDIAEDGRHQRRVRRDAEVPFGDWPYCAMCYRLSESAARIELNGGEAGLAPGWSEGLSGKHCELHKPGKGTAYQSGLRALPRFRLAMKEILREAREDRDFRSRFARKEDDSAFDELWANPQKFLRMAARDPLPWSPLIYRMREYAHAVATRHPGHRTVSIARLTHAGLSRSDVACALGITVDAVRQRIALAQDASFDFGRRAELLIWWPGRWVCDSSIFRFEPAGNAS